MQFSERFVVDCRHVPLWRGGTGRALVCALRARAALILLFWSCTGGHCRRWRGRGASLFFKVCDNYCDISHCDCQLLRGTSVHIFQSGSKINETTFIKRIKINKESSLENPVWLVLLAPHTDGSNFKENGGSSKYCMAEDDGLTFCFPRQPGLWQQARPQRNSLPRRAPQRELCWNHIPNAALPERRTLQQSQADRSQAERSISSPRGRWKGSLIWIHHRIMCPDVMRQGCDSAIQNHMKAFDHGSFIPILELCSCKHRRGDNLASLSAALSLHKSDAQSACV